MSKQLLAVAIVVACCLSASAQQCRLCNSLVNYQFLAQDSDGNPVADGPHSTVFSIWDDSTGGNQLWVESRMVTTEGGLGTVELGQVAPLSLNMLAPGLADTAGRRYLQVELEGEVISPRTELISVPYAASAKRVFGDIGTMPGELHLFPTEELFGDYNFSLLNSDTAGAELRMNKADIVENIAELNAKVDDDGSHLVLAHIGTSGEDGMSIELDADRDSVGDIEARMSFFGLVEAGPRSHAKKPKEIVVVGSKVKEVVRYYENDLEDEVATREYVSGRATGKRMHSPFKVTGAALPDSTPGYEVRVDSAGTQIMLAKNNTDGTSNWLETRTDTAGTSLAMNKADLIDKLASAKMSVEDDPSHELQTVSLGSGDTTRVLAQASDTEASFHLSNIASGDEDGIEAKSSNGRKTVRAHDFMASASDTGSGFELSAAQEEASLRLSSGNSGSAANVLATASGTGSRLKLGGTVAGKYENNLWLDTTGGGLSFSEILPTRAVVEKIALEHTPTSSKLYVGNLGFGSSDGVNITSDFAAGGRVGINTNTPSVALHVDGDICYTGGISACSDFRYKRNVTTLPKSLSRVLQLRGVSYRWQQDEHPDLAFDNNKHIGFIAQEVEPLFPELVTTDENGYKSIDYSRLTPVLVEAIKEQQQTIDELRSELDEIKMLLTGLGQVSDAPRLAEGE